MLHQNTTNESSIAEGILLQNLEQSQSDGLFSRYLSKIKSLEIEQVKLYLGFAYFFAVSLISVSLLLF